MARWPKSDQPSRVQSRYPSRYPPVAGRACRSPAWLSGPSIHSSSARRLAEPAQSVSYLWREAHLTHPPSWLASISGRTCPVARPRGGAAEPPWAAAPPAGPRGGHLAGWGGPLIRAAHLPDSSRQLSCQLSQPAQLTSCPADHRPNLSSRFPVVDLPFSLSSIPRSRLL